MYRVVAYDDHMADIVYMYNTHTHTQEAAVVAAPVAATALVDMGGGDDVMGVFGEGGEDGEAEEGKKKKKKEKRGKKEKKGKKKRSEEAVEPVPVPAPATEQTGLMDIEFGTPMAQVIHCRWGVWPIGILYSYSCL